MDPIFLVQWRQGCGLVLAERRGIGLYRFLFTANVIDEALRKYILYIPHPRAPHQIKCKLIDGEIHVILMQVMRVLRTEYVLTTIQYISYVSCMAL